MPTTTTTTIKTMTREERIYQKTILDKYREFRTPTGFVPSLQEISVWSGTSVGSAAKFVNGNSNLQAIRDFLVARAKKKLDPLPAEVQKLFDIWKRTTIKS